MKRGYTLPVIDLAQESHRQVVVDREAGQYLGHPTTCLLEDGQTMLCVYPKGHGRGAIVYKRSTDGGKTWSKPTLFAHTIKTQVYETYIDFKNILRNEAKSGL